MNYTAAGRDLVDSLALVVGATDGRLGEHGEPFAERIVSAVERGVRAIEREARPDRHSLAQALPEHRYCTDNIRGHESCLAAADTILRNLEGGK